jgi:ABC-type multidrug transport system permease subunit
VTGLQGELLGIVRRDRARQQRRRKFAEIVTDFIASVIADALHALVQGWMLMLAVSMVHAYWMPSVPTVGYWWSVLLVWLLRGTFTAAPRLKGGDR